MGFPPVRNGWVIRRGDILTPIFRSTPSSPLIRSSTPSMKSGYRKPTFIFTAGCWDSYRPTRSIRWQSRANQIIRSQAGRQTGLSWAGQSV